MIIYPSQYPTEHTCGDRTPYTYHIAWSWIDKHYYGSRYGKDVHPSDLWNPYKTSSEHVAVFIKEHGEPDIIQVRKIFNDVESAREYEHQVLKRLNVIYKDNWLNIHPGNGSFYNISNNPNLKLRGTALYKDIRGNYIRTSVNDPRVLSGELVGVCKGIPNSNETKHKKSIGNLGKPKSESHKANMRGKSNYRDKDGNIVNCKTNDPRVLSGELISIYIGRKTSDKTRELLHQIHNGIGTYRDKEGNFIRLHKDDPRVISGELAGNCKGTATYKDKDGNKFRLTVDDPRVISGELVSIQYGRTLEKFICEHCGKEIGGKTNYLRWHGENCRSLRDNSSIE